MVVKGCVIVNVDAAIAVASTISFFLHCFRMTRHEEFQHEDKSVAGMPFVAHGRPQQKQAQGCAELKGPGCPCTNVLNPIKGMSVCRMLFIWSGTMMQDPGRIVLKKVRSSSKAANGRCHVAESGVQICALNC